MTPTVFYQNLYSTKLFRQMFSALSPLSMLSHKHSSKSPNFTKNSSKTTQIPSQSQLYPHRKNVLKESKEFVRNFTLNKVQISPLYPSALSSPPLPGL